MDKLESIRRRQQQDAVKRERAVRPSDSDNAPKRPSSANSSHRRRRRKKKNKAKKLFRTILILLVLGIIAMSAAIVWATWGMDFDFTDSFNKMGMDLTSIVYYEDENGDEVYFERLIADQNRIWVDAVNVPDDMKDAFVAIEDQRFYSHGGVDVKRTTGAVINVLTNGDSSYGGSTITQQLIKNVTMDSERSKARKIREMVRAVILERKMDKDQILELYMNSIYLGHGANGVQAAAKVYFDKDVSELSLVECAAIAGITKYPSAYDPILNPQGNKDRRQLVLDKMYELEFISEEEYNIASSAELDVVSREDDLHNTTQSYFVDYLYEELLADLMEIKGYTQTYASDLIYNGGLRIISTVDPDIQSIMDDVYAKGNGYPSFYGEAPQSAMVITDPSTGEIRGIVGGKGQKTGARVLNRASQTRRQPGSTIKPIAVYAPAIDNGTITLASMVQNSPLDINGWTPKNANNKFSGPVSIRSAVAHSYNLPAIRVLEELTVDTSFDYMTDKLHIDLVRSRKEGSVYVSDKGYAPLALGGLTDGVTVMEMNSAYSSFANGGEYIQPTSYTKVYDAGGKILINKTPERNQAFSEETAFIMTRLLKGVMDMGTAAGYGISGMDTCGKTGSTDDNMDRWFAGFTPYYVGTVWVGYDEQKVISYGGVNPALTIWHNVMRRVHENYEPKTFDQPIGVDRVYTCSNTGEFGTSRCSGSTDYVNTRLMTGYCSGVHDNIIGTPGVWNPKPEKKEDETTSEADDTASSDASDNGNSYNSTGNASTGTDGETAADTSADDVSAE